MLTNRLRAIIMDPISLAKNWWIGMIAAMILGDALNVNAKISNFLNQISGGRL